uniref:Protein stand still n=2 Tax=Bactrocera dorsalis TaxID=27457 RepID=A0A034WS56_BACDO
MEINKPTLDLPNLPTTDEIALEMANKVCLGNSAQSKQKISLDTSISSDKTIFPDTNSRNVHIPYILNGELFEIQTQDGENVTVKCCNCPPDRVYRGSVRSTGNFHMHIKRRHPDLMGKIYDMKVNALVERRDRFLRNRKSTRRRNTNVNGSRASSSRNEQRLACPGQPTSELFKIKAAFQRHQLQQQQQNRIQQDQSQRQQKREKNASILHKWNVIDHFLITPAFERARDITLMEAYNEQPLNYSLKQNTVSNMSCTERAQEIDANDADTSDNLNANNISGTIDTSEHITGYEVMSRCNKASNSVSLMSTCHFMLTTAISPCSVALQL